MTSIEIDFDVYKALTVRRLSETDTYNEVLRRLLDLGDVVSPQVDEPDPEKGCVMQGVFFPEGTQFQVKYKWQLYKASIKDGRWVDQDGVVRRSPSDAATAITGNNVNGWRFWRVKRPGDPEFRKLQELQQ